MVTLTQILAAMLAVASNAEAAEPQLLVPGLHRRAEVRLQDGDAVLALCGGRTLRTRVRVQHAELPDQVRVTVPCDAKAIFRGPDDVVPRGAHIRKGPQLLSSPRGPKFVRLRLSNSVWRVDRERLGSSGYRLTLSGGREPVTLYECQSTDAARWELLWAGDLDGDAKIDLLIDASDAFDLSELRLFLSRGAEEDVDEAALLRTKLSR